MHIGTELWRPSPLGPTVGRSSWESDHERLSPGSGPASKSRCRQSPFRSGGRWHGAQLAIDTTVSPVRMDGSARRQCATTDGANARVRKERTYPELAQAQRSGTPGGGGLRSRRPVVGRGPSFLNSLANAKVRDQPGQGLVVEKVEGFVGAAARAFALSLLERCCAPGCDGPTDEVVQAHRYEA